MAQDCVKVCCTTFGISKANGNSSFHSYNSDAFICSAVVFLISLGKNALFCL